MERPESDAPLADPGTGAVPNDMPVDPEQDAEAAQRPARTERQTPEPRPHDDE